MLLVNSGYAVLGAEEEVDEGGRGGRAADEGGAGRAGGGQRVEDGHNGDLEESEENEDFEDEEETEDVEIFLSEEVESFIKEVMIHEVGDQIEKEETIPQVDGGMNSSEASSNDFSSDDFDVANWGNSRKNKENNGKREERRDERREERDEVEGTAARTERRNSPEDEDDRPKKRRRIARPIESSDSEEEEETVKDKLNRLHKNTPGAGSAKLYEFFSAAEVTPSNIAEHANHISVVRDLERDRTSVDKKVLLLVVDQGAGMNHLHLLHPLH